MSETCYGISLTWTVFLALPQDKHKNPLLDDEKMNFAVKLRSQLH